MSVMWMTQCFTCCISEQAPPRRRIDRTMIGEPTNFIHTMHVGSGDMHLGGFNLNTVQSQMRSKGGYDYSRMSNSPSSLSRTSNATHSHKASNNSNLSSPPPPHDQQMTTKTKIRH